MEEDDDFAGGGDLTATLVGIKADGNGAGGDAELKIREKGLGDLTAMVRNAQTNGNLTDGINIREDADGNHRLLPSTGRQPTETPATASTSTSGAPAA